MKKKKSVVHLYCKKDPNDENITFHTSFCKPFFNTFNKNLKFGGAPRNNPRQTGWETLLYSQFLSRLVSTLIFLPPNSVKTNSRLHRRIFLVSLKRPRFYLGPSVVILPCTIFSIPWLEATESCFFKYIESHIGYRSYCLLLSSWVPSNKVRLCMVIIFI